MGTDAAFVLCAYCLCVGVSDVRNAEVMFHDKKIFGKENCVSIVNNRTTMYVCCEKIAQAELWISGLQKAIVKGSFSGDTKVSGYTKYNDAEIKAVYKGRKPVCIFTGNDKGPWQQAPKLSELNLPAPNLTVGDRASTQLYKQNKKVRHVQVQTVSAYCIYSFCHFWF
jgi:hypothetical protein